LLDAVRRISPATLAHLLPDDEGGSGLDPERVEAYGRTPVQVLLRTALQEAIEPRGGVLCRVPDLTLTDILQLYHQLRRSVTVLVSGRIAGSIRLESGELVHAESDAELGEAALCRLLECDAGLVRTDTSAFAGPATISAPFHQVLFDAMDRLEARRQAVAAEPPGVSGEAHLDERLLSGPASEYRIELPDATSFETGNSWQRARKVLFIALGASVAAVSLYVLLTLQR
jgi:hypothetical protein